MITSDGLQVKTLKGQDSVFRLLKAGDTDTALRSTSVAIHGELRNHLTTWVRKQGFSSERTEHIRDAALEAIKNAIEYGCRARDVIDIRLMPPGAEGFLEVEITQPQRWEDWDKRLGERRRRAVRMGQSLMGGTVIMLRVADGIQVTDLGRKLRMRFYPAVVSAQSHVSRECKPD